MTDINGRAVGPEMVIAPSIY